MYINWEARSYIVPNSPDPFVTHGIPLPTYGNYGGPNYSAGEVGGKITGTSADPPSVDPLDKLFYLHDFAYQTSADPLERAAADVQLVESMHALRIPIPATLITTPRPVCLRGLRPLELSLGLRPAAYCNSSPLPTNS